ncbi:hypothetical protein AX774_g8238, partial [Zancudomyces culisetae]
MSQNIENNFQS